MKNSKFTRIANLSSLWRKFYDKKEENSFFELFTALNTLSNAKDEKEKEEEAEIKLKEFDKVDRLRYLAFLAEIVSYTKIDSVDKENAMHLFHWLFYFVFLNPNTRDDFWSNIGSDKERTSDSWKADREFAEDCEKYMYDKGILKKD